MRVRNGYQPKADGSELKKDNPPKVKPEQQEPKGTGWKMHKLMKEFIDSAEGSDSTSVTLLISSEDMIDVLDNIVHLTKSGDNAEILHVINGYCIGYKQSLINQKNMWSRSQGGER